MEDIWQGWVSLDLLIETLSKLICHVSALKVDDVRLKGSTLASKSCTLFDLGHEEDVTHLVLQCPAFEDVRSDMFSEICQLPNKLGANLLENEVDSLGILLSRNIVDYTIEQIEIIWLISGKFIDVMYIKNIRTKKGEG